jgi:hypothetical protein
MTGMALGWIGFTSALGSVVRKPNRSLVVSPSLTFLTDVHLVQTPAKKARGRLSSSANHTGGREPSCCSSCSAKLVNGTTHRLSGPSHRRQWGDLVLRMFVTPGSDFFPVRANASDGMPHLAITSSRPSGRVNKVGSR